MAALRKGLETTKGACCTQLCGAQFFSKVLDLVYEVTIDGSFEKLYVRDHKTRVFHIIVSCAEIRNRTSSTI